jgi:hypothetical protein
MLSQPWVCERCCAIGVARHFSSASPRDIVRIVLDEHRLTSPSCGAPGHEIVMVLSLAEGRRVLEGRRAVGLCGICAEEGRGEIQNLDGKRVFVCDRCETEHPRVGHYTFDEAQGKASPAPFARHGPKRGR